MPIESGISDEWRVTDLSTQITNMPLISCRGALVTVEVGALHQTIRLSIRQLLDRGPSPPPPRTHPWFHVNSTIKIVILLYFVSSLIDTNTTIQHHRSAVGFISGININFVFIHMFLSYSVVRHPFCFHKFEVSILDSYVQWFFMA
jgi:hypothetical protein